MTDEQMLIAQHRHIGEYARAIMAIARTSDTRMGAKIAPLRLKLAALLKDHFDSEQHLLVNRLTGALRDKVPMLDTVLKRTRDLRFAYSEHVVAWPSRAIDADHPGYVHALERLMVALEAQIVFEEQHMVAPAFAALREAGLAPQDYQRGRNTNHVASPATTPPTMFAHNSDV